MVFDRLCAFPMLCLVRQTPVRELPESARLLGYAPVRLHVYRRRAHSKSADPAGHLWQTQDIQSVTALMSLVAALPFRLLAVFKTEWASCSRSHDEEMSRPDAPGRSP
jgi:hypothetical protein